MPSPPSKLKTAKRVAASTAAAAAAALLSSVAAVSSSSGSYGLVTPARAADGESTRTCLVRNSNGCIKFDESVGWVQFCPYYGNDRADTADRTDSGCVAIKPYRFNEIDSTTGSEYLMRDENGLRLRSNGKATAVTFSKKCSATGITSLVACLPDDVEQSALQAFSVPLRMELGYATVQLRVYLFTTGGVLAYGGKRHTIARNSFKFDLWCDTYPMQYSASTGISLDFLVRNKDAASNANTIQAMVGVDDERSIQAGAGGASGSGVLSSIDGGVMIAPQRYTYLPIDGTFVPPITTRLGTSQAAATTMVAPTTPFPTAPPTTEAPPTTTTRTTTTVLTTAAEIPTFPIAPTLETLPETTAAAPAATTTPTTAAPPTTAPPATSVPPSAGATTTAASTPAATTAVSAAPATTAVPPATGPATTTTRAANGTTTAAPLATTTTTTTPLTTTTTRLNTTTASAPAATTTLSAATTTAAPTSQQATTQAATNSSSSAAATSSAPAVTTTAFIPSAATTTSSGLPQTTVPLGTTGSSSATAVSTTAAALTSSNVLTTLASERATTTTAAAGGGTTTSAAGAAATTTTTAGAGPTTTTRPVTTATTGANATTAVANRRQLHAAADGSTLKAATYITRALGGEAGLDDGEYAFWGDVGVTLKQRTATTQVLSFTFNNKLRAFHYDPFVAAAAYEMNPRFGSAAVPTTTMTRSGGVFASLVVSVAASMWLLVLAVFA